jgi:plasmid stabilization system protein ParE
MNEYAFHPEAFADLDELWEYIAKHNVDAADRVVDDIFRALRTLVASPHIGHWRPDLTTRPLRFHVVRDHLIVYAPDRTAVGRGDSPRPSESASDGCNPSWSRGRHDLTYPQA